MRRPQSGQLSLKEVSAWLIERMVREGQRQGSIERQLLPRTAAMLFLGMIVPAGVVWHLTDRDFNLTQHAGRVWKMFHKALIAKGR